MTGRRAPFQPNPDGLFELVRTGNPSAPRDEHAPHFNPADPLWRLRQDGVDFAIISATDDEDFDASRWASDTVKHYTGRDVIWRPNGGNAYISVEAQ